VIPFFFFFFFFFGFGGGCVCEGGGGERRELKDLFFTNFIFSRIICSFFSGSGGTAAMDVDVCRW